MGDPSLGKGDGLKKDREEEDVQPPSKATTTGEESALSPSAESSKGAHGGSPKEESRKTDGKNAEEIASQPVQMPEPEELPALQSEEMPESVPAPMRPSSRNSHVSKTSKNSSMRGKKAGIQKRERVYAQKMPSDAVHQAMEDGRSTPPLPPTATTPPASTSGSTNSSATRWNASAHKVAIDSAKTNLFVTLTRTDNDNAPKTAALNLATAQRLVLAGYQHQITETLYKAITLEDKDDAADELRLLNTQLHEYCMALRDLEYMQDHAARHAKNDELDPFYLKSSKHIQRLAMEEAGWIPDHVLPKGPLPIARDHDDPQLPGLSRTVAHRASESEQLWVRFGMASAGGIILVVPMLIMASRETKTASLVTTCIAMFLFATGVTFGTHLKPDQVLGATAAYAAVLVVFVGTSFST